MKLDRPHIPIDVKLLVAARQLVQRNGLARVLTMMDAKWSKQSKLDWMLHELFGSGPVHLDHDPPLVLRPRSVRTGKYVPDANNPEHLVYRTVVEHHIKTFVHGDGAQLSDAAKRRKAIKQKRKEEGKRTRGYRPIKSRNEWPKGRKFPTRG